MLEVTVTQERPSLWHLGVGLSPWPGVMGLESDKQGHCLKSGAYCRAAPQRPRRGGWGIWGGSHSLLAQGSTDANKLFFNELFLRKLFCPFVNSCQTKECGLTVCPRDAWGISGAAGSEKAGRWVSHGTSSAALEIGLLSTRTILSV